MRRLLFLLIAGGLAAQPAAAQLPVDNPQAANILLPNGWSLTPAGTSLPLGDLPLNMQLAPGGRLLAVTNNGQSTQTVQLIDPVSEQLLDEKKIGKSWYGLAWSPGADRLYVSGGNDNVILSYPVAQQKLGAPDTLRLGKRWPTKISPVGIAVHAPSQRLYTVTKEDNALYVLDLKTGRTLQRVDLGHEAYGCLLSPDARTLYITLWGGNELVAFDTQTGQLARRLATESHPNELIQSKNGRYLFVANANDNSVSVVDVRRWQVLETINTALYPTRLTGSTTNGLALSPDEKTLYIAKAPPRASFPPAGTPPACARWARKYW